MKDLVFLLSYPIDLIKMKQFETLFEKEGALIHADPKQDYDIVLVPPGDDVHPFLYGQKKMPKTAPNYIRDRHENNFIRSIPRNKPKIGISRGAQLLNVIYGGSLYQHVTGHTSPHMMYDFVSGNEMLINSYHHQEIILPDTAWLVAAASSASEKHTPTKTSMVNWAQNQANSIYLDTEVGFMKDENVLLFQPDPTLQFNSVAQNNTWSYFKELLDEYLIEEMNKKNKKVA